MLPLLDEIQDPGWFWDTEFMVRAARRGLRMVEIPGAYIRRERQDLDGERRPRLDPLLRAAAALPRPAAARGPMKALAEIGWARALRFGFFTRR